MSDFQNEMNRVVAGFVSQITELARRADFGETFDSGFLHRNNVCLGCHNSERSVTE